MKDLCDECMNLDTVKFRLPFGKIGKSKGCPYDRGYYDIIECNHFKKKTNRGLE